MKKINLLLLLLCLPFFTTTLYGQHKKRVKRSNSMKFSFIDNSVDSLEDVVKKQGFLYGGVSGINHVTTLGRDNNINQWGIDPLLGWHKKNMDVYVNGFRWSQSAPKWAETDVGISNLWGNNHPLSIVATYEHAFIRAGSDDDKFGLNNLAFLKLIWKNKLFEMDARYEYDWGRSCATIFEASIGHEFDIFDIFGKDKIEIEPRFYTTYLGSVTYPVRFFKSNALCTQPFQIANYQLELPITWRKIGNIEWNVSFLYDIPKNVLMEEGSGKPVFYVTSSLVKVFRLRRNKARQ
jgi:hypothetical protein